MIEYVYFGLLAIAGIQDIIGQRIFKILCWMLMILGILMFMEHLTWLNIGIVAVEVMYVLITSKILEVGLGDVIIWCSLCFALVDNALLVILIGILSAIAYSIILQKESVPLIPFTILGLMVIL